MIKSLLMVLSMLAVGVLVWRVLQRQEAANPSDAEPPAGSANTRDTGGRPGGNPG
jgi:hypothetical protein